jgi:hypothetical protein
VKILNRGEAKWGKLMFVMSNANIFVTELPHKYIFPIIDLYVLQLMADITNLKPNSRVHQ